MMHSGYALAGEGDRLEDETDPLDVERSGMTSASSSVLVDDPCAAEHRGSIDRWNKHYTRSIVRRRRLFLALAAYHMIAAGAFLCGLAWRPCYVFVLYVEVFYTIFSMYMLAIVACRREEDATRTMLKLTTFLIFILTTFAICGVIAVTGYLRAYVGREQTVYIDQLHSVVAANATQQQQQQQQQQQATAGPIVNGTAATNYTADNYTTAAAVAAWPADSSPPPPPPDYCPLPYVLAFTVTGGLSVVYGSVFAWKFRLVIWFL